MPFMRSESCSFIWHPKVVTWKRLASVIEASGYRGPRGRLARRDAREVCVRLPGSVGLVGRGRAVAGSELVDRIVDRTVRSPRADHEDHARAIAGADRDVVRAGRAVQVVPLMHLPLFALDDHDALAGEDEEALL